MIGSFLARLRPSPPDLPDDLWQATLDSLPFLAGLEPGQIARLRELAREFLADKEFSAAGGLDLTDEICLSIAVQGCLPILELGLGCYRDWRGIVVYPDEFVIPRSVADEFGIVHEYTEVAAGEAWSGGPLLVSWRDARMAGDGYNVVIHEFAHKLDMLNGEIDGIPRLPPTIPLGRWQSVLAASYADFCGEVERAERRREDTEIDPYAAENPAEFFAVMSEVFFETPEVAFARYPEFYELLAGFYRQDPLPRRLAAHGDQPR